MKKYIIVLTLVAMLMVCILGLVGCGDTPISDNSVDGTYYYFDGEKLDKTKAITLKDGEWNDSFYGSSGTYKKNGSSLTFYENVFGSDEEIGTGTASKGVLTIEQMGVTSVYYKEGKQPSGSQPDKPTPDKPKYTITYDANGGAFEDGTSSYTQTAQEGSLLTAPTAPTKLASAFSGWATDKRGKNLWKFATDTVSENMTLYAVWQEQAAVIISVDGASIDEKNMSVYMLVDNDITSVSLSNKVVCSENSVWRLYYDKLGQTEIPTKIASGIGGELLPGDNLFYIVVTSADGTQVNVYKLVVHRSYSASAYYYDSQDNLIYTDTLYTGYEYEVDYVPTITGYTFNHWLDENGKKVSSVTPNKSMRFVANCTPHKYDVTLDVNGGDPIFDTEYTATYGEIPNFAEPSRKGHTFVGWYNDDDEMVVDAAGRWAYDSNVALRAKWETNRYAVSLVYNEEAATLNVNDYGTQPTEDGKYLYNTKITLESSHVKLGWTWLGWYDGNKKLSSDTEYTFYVPDQDITYTAKYELDENLENFEYTATESTLEICGLKDTSIDEIVVPSYTTKIEDAAFAGCGNLKSITLSNAKEERALLRVFGTNYFSGSIKVSGYDFYYYVPEYLSSVTITGGSYIGGSAFYGCSGLTSITIPNSVTGIGSYAFYNCSGLTSIIIPDSVTRIATCAFRDCSGLTSLTIPDSVTSIGEYAFRDCSGLTSITIPNSVTSFSLGSFEGCSGLTSITIPNSVTEIATGAFYGCSGLTSITIPDSVTSILDSAFAGCSGLTSITIPNSVTYIGSYAFENCSGLTSITIPNSITCIYDWAFRDCSGLTSVTIPDSVTRISIWAFKSCSGLTTINYQSTVNQWRQISKGHDWDVDTGLYTIVCTDGTISKDGTVTQK